MKHISNLASAVALGAIGAEPSLFGAADTKRSLLAAPALIRARTRDGMMTFDRRTIDSTGVFLVGELERLDQKLHDPLVAVTWSRDIQLREDVTIADEVSSFTNSSFAAAGGVNPNGKAWVGKDASSIAGMSLDIGKTANPLTLWGMEVSWTLPELESAQKAGRPVDAQKFNGMNLKHQMDTDEQVYIGDDILGQSGLVNSSLVAVGNVANGASGSPKFINKTPDEILADFNELLTTCWANSGWALMPGEVRLPPAEYGYLATVKVSEAGNASILTYVQENNIVAKSGGKLNIQPLKWLIGRGVGGTPGDAGTVNRMIAYTNDQDRVRFPMVPLQRTPLEYRSLFQITTYYGRLGVVEFVYPETALYRDGI